MNDYICLVLGETGEGKSSFINSKTKSSEKNKNQNYCKTSPDSKACTRKFKISKTYYENNCYAFIDTPGLNDIRGDEKNINEIKNGLSDYPTFRCILVLMKFQDNRLTDSTVKNLKIFMEWFPTKNFWDHVFIVRTHADHKGRSFDEDKASIEGKIVQSFQENEFSSFKKFMEDRKIKIPDKIDEFYADNPKKFEGESNFNYNKEQFENIFEKIKDTPPMFKEVSKEDRETMDDSNKFPVLQKWRTIIYVDYEGKPIKSSPFLSSEVEKCPYPIHKIISEKVEIETESDCGDVRIKYNYYETCVYEVPDKSDKSKYNLVFGKRCFKRTGWE